MNPAALRHDSYICIQDYNFTSPPFTREVHNRSAPRAEQFQAIQNAPMTAPVALGPCSTSFPTPGAKSTRPSSGELYQPLTHPNSIRLLEIQPGTLTESIHCRLFVSHLDRHSPSPSYEAISYVWGSPDIRESVRCNEATIRITSNLAAALRRFRLPTEPRVVWADGICINQADDSEKGHQVRLMRLIYKRAARVLVWLGQPSSDEQPRAAFNALCALVNQTLSPTDPPATWDEQDDTSDPHPLSSSSRINSDDSLFSATTTASSTSSISSLSSLSLTSTAEPAGSSSSAKQRSSAILADRWAALAPFFGLAWFRRVWVIQEVALSSAATALHWGRARIAWALVARATDRIVALKHRLPLHRLPGALHAHLMGDLWQAEQRRNVVVVVGGEEGKGEGEKGEKEEEQRMTFDELHAKTIALSFVASDPRDRVYGLLGIPTRETEPDEGLLYLEPDYGVNLVGVHVRLLQKRRMLLLLENSNTPSP
ncbi:Heterokaryon incompatibility protein 6 [Lasiodiplodia hormozganensis]|uniref:Heterokaryon incompatibility protein 6 n=1 Tax=Lasiodiplodia hormozganensis TaxID=869390 RepID=A0AA39Z2K9_9PEZI|nr:Heterokaryon incompatibility protein 6 [Lasiodiplodia hormozganensis]